MKGFIAAAIAFVGVIATDDDVSRAGQSFQQVIALSTTGLIYPTKSFNLAQDPSQEPTWPGHLSPLGQRQHYLIGSELRKRYVDEATFITDLYSINQVWMQTPFTSYNIQSLQAQMIGLYPPSDLNTLTDWQQSNAVPPIKDADFSEWQEELGDQALPYGFNVFPIQQNGLDADLQLAVSAVNCPTYIDFAKTQVEYVNNTIYPVFETTYPNQASLLIENNGNLWELCHYIEWAWFSMVDLNQQDTYDAIWQDTCVPIKTTQQQDLASFDMENSNFVSSGFYTMVYTALTADSTATDNIFTALQTLNNETLYSYAANMLIGDLTVLGVLPPTSNLVIELTTEGQVNAFFNDVQYQINGCSSMEECAVNDVLETLKSMTEVAAIDVCTSSTKEQVSA